MMNMKKTKRPKKLVKPVKHVKEQKLLAQAGGLECTNNKTIC